MAAELAHGSAGVALTLHVHWMAANVILKFGDAEQKQKWLPDMARGKRLAAYTLSEASAGSDIGAIQAVAAAHEGGYKLDGVKYFATNGNIADLFVLAFKTDREKGAKGISLFVVDRATAGVRLGAPLDKMGCRSSDTATIILEDCIVPQNALLGNENGGFKIAMYGLVSGRVGMCSMGIGISEAALAEAISYANHRIAFGKPLAALYSVQEKIAEMETKLIAARLMTDDVAKRIDAGEDCSVASSISKIFVAEATNEICYNALQIFGGHGYVRNSVVERCARDGRLMDIGVGATEVLKMAVGTAVLRKNEGR
jgi:butyryl-CoA dehydrogenase